MELQKQNRDAVVASSKLQIRKMRKGKIKANVKFPVIWSVYSWGVHFKLDEDYDFFLHVFHFLSLLGTTTFHCVGIGPFGTDLNLCFRVCTVNWGLAGTPYLVRRKSNFRLGVDVGNGCFRHKRIGVLNPGSPFSTGYYLSVKVKKCNMAFTTSHNRSGKNTIWIQCHWPICAPEFTQ